jgi:hypothetical protein
MKSFSFLPITLPWLAVNNRVSIGHILTSSAMLMILYSPLVIPRAQWVRAEGWCSSRPLWLDKIEEICYNKSIADDIGRHRKEHAMVRQKERGPAVAAASPRSEEPRSGRFGVSVAHNANSRKFAEVRGQAQAEFMAYRERGGELDAIAWLFAYRPRVFNLWVTARTEALARGW